MSELSKLFPVVDSMPGYEDYICSLHDLADANIPSWVFNVCIPFFFIGVVIVSLISFFKIPLTVWRVNKAIQLDLEAVKLGAFKR